MFVSIRSNRKLIEDTEMVTLDRETFLQYVTLLRIRTPNGPNYIPIFWGKIKSIFYSFIQANQSYIKVYAIL